MGNLLLRNPPLLRLLTFQTSSGMHRELSTKHTACCAISRREWRALPLDFNLLLSQGLRCLELRGRSKAELGGRLGPELTLEHRRP